MQNICIDRIEGEVAVCEGANSQLEIPLCRLPHGVKEGDWILFDGEHYLLNQERTQQARERAAARFSALKKRGKGHG